MSTALRVLHIAPEPGLERRLRRLGNLDYVTGDLFTGETDIVVDLTNIDAPDGSFDVMICSHVLEHVADDKQAMREMRRVIKPGGWAFMVVPYREDLIDTYEDWTIIDPKAREDEFGQDDHVRWYSGADFEKRLLGAGFAVKRVRAGSEIDRRRYVLDGPGVADWMVICS